MTTGRPMSLVPLLLALGLGACAPDRQTLEVDVSGLAGTGVSALEVDVNLTGERTWSAPTEEIRRRLDRFVLRLPAELRGQVSVKVQAVDGGGCALAAGEAQVEVAGLKSTAVHVDLLPDARAHPGCRLRLARIGPQAGRVRARGGGIDCGGAEQRCEATYPKRSRVELEVTDLAAEDNVYFTGWSGPCTGLGACSVEIGSGTQTVRANFAARQVCNAKGWCWERPRPEGTVLNGLWASGPSDVWAVGNEGRILHSDGVEWTPMATGYEENLLGIWGSDAEDVWVVGAGGRILHFDGFQWRAVESGTTEGMLRVHGVPPPGPGPVGPGRPLHLFVGSQDFIRHLQWDGTALTTVEAGSQSWRGETKRRVILFGVWAAAADDAWAAGALTEDFGQTFSAGTLLHFDGREWQERLPAAQRSTALFSAWGSGPRDVWFAGSGGLLLRWDGAGLTTVDTRTPATYYHVSGSGPDDVWAVRDDGILQRFRRDGSSERFNANSRGALTASFGTTGGDRWAVGNGGALVHWNGAYFSAYRAGSQERLAAIGGTSAGARWALGHGGTLLQLDGDVWQPLRFGVSTNWLGIAPFGRDSFWLAGAAGYLMTRRPDGHVALTQADDFPTYLGIWSKDGVDCWAVGVLDPETSRKGRLHHLRWDDATQDFVDVERWLIDFPAQGVWGSARDDVWAVGTQVIDDKYLLGHVLHFDGGAWSYVKTPELPLRVLAVWGTGPRDVWVGGGLPSYGIVAGRGILLHFDGSSWTSTDVRREVHAIHGTGPRNVWAVSDTGLAYHFDGTRWTEEATGQQVNLNGVFAEPGGGAITIGDFGAILRRKGDP